MVLVRQPRTVLHPARPLLADPVLRRLAQLERTHVPCPLAEPRDANRGDTAVLERPNSARASDLGGNDQRRRALRVRNDPAHWDREKLHPHRFLALVGGAFVGRAIVRVLRSRDERVPADVARTRIAQACRAVRLSRAYPDLHGRSARDWTP